MKPKELVKGKIYTWTMGAELLNIKYIGRSHENKDIKCGSICGYGYIFQREKGSYMEIGVQTLREYVEQDKTSLT